ncbi:hypothetical protein HJG60_011743 [Phyllostomus discolor]|uniref:Uncharacterized protein n=1 Tax=Phyllostomus discolor TaxID=89673 RepID=A0A834E1F8_9CHIR|nr:hypothetical protein HJG60_011743 [Phyllostomus discolor]
MSICTLQREVYCLWLGNAVVLSERANGVGPAADSLGVWRGDICRMASQRRPCGECRTSVPAEGQPKRAERVSRTAKPAAWECVYTWKTLLGTLPHVHATPSMAAWSPKLMESLETSHDQTMKELREWMNFKVQMFLLFTEGSRVQNCQMRKLGVFRQLRDGSLANSCQQTPEG